MGAVSDPGGLDWYAEFSRDRVLPLMSASV